jgi:RNA polymerase sigma-70 factor (ECF subfamily)
MAHRPDGSDPSELVPTFRARLEALFEAHYRRLFRVVQRHSGEPELAADVVQGAFVRLYRRGSLPDQPEAWLISVAMNLLRNEKSTQSRRLRLLAPVAALEPTELPPSLERAHHAVATRRRVRAALERLEERDRMLLTLRAEGYRYRDLAVALELNEASIGTLLARARRAFLAAYEEETDAPR